MISVIVPTKSNLPLLKQCIKSLRRCHIADEIIVVDNGDEGAGRWARRNGCEVVYTDNAPFAKSCNLGVLASQGTHILLCNDDIQFMGNIPYATKDITGYRLVYPNGLLQHGGIGFDMTGNPYHLWHLAPGEHMGASKSYPVPAVTFALAMIKRELWDELKGMDESYVNAYEDIDFCLRAREAGYMTWYSGRESAIHLTSQTAGRNDHVVESWQHFGKKWLANGRLYKALGVWPVEKSECSS